MCGILAAHTPERIEDASINAALDAMLHRGPDDAGTLRDGPAVLAMRRLAIIDLDSGQQPICSEDGQVAVVCNGEIYNYRELAAQLSTKGHQFATSSDTEVLVHLYEEYGEAMCQHLAGMYAFVIWDARRQRLFGARDRFGKKPLYYCRTNAGGLLLASELKSLRALAQPHCPPWQVSEQAVYDYLSLGVVPQPQTIYEGVRSLPPASQFTFRDGEFEVQTYWSLDFDEKSNHSYPQAIARTRHLVRDAVRRRLIADVPLGVFLSGGVDSSVVAYEAAEVVGPELQTFTVAMDDSRLDESGVAARTARQLGVRNTVLKLDYSPIELLEQIVGHYDQPYSDSSAIPSLAVSRLARQHVTVVLNGDGGDEVFGGYRRHLAMNWQDRIPRLARPLLGLAARGLQPLAARRRSLLGFAARMCRGISQHDAEKYLTWTMDLLRQGDKLSVWRGGRMRATEAWLAGLGGPRGSSLDRQQFTDMQVNLLSDLLVKMDMATMAHSLEGRSPLLDHELAEYVASTPPSFRCGWKTPKRLLRDAYRGRLSDEVIDGRKRGFEIPLARWLSGEFRPLLNDLVCQPTAMIRGYLDGKFVDRLLAGEEMQDRNWPHMVYSLLVLEMWLRRERAELAAPKQPPTSAINMMNKAA